MSIGDALKFEKFNFGKMFDDLKKDPKRIFLGVDPLSTKGWNAVLGRDDEPIVGHFGAPKKENFQAAQDQGINTGTASTLHGIAQGIAAAYGTAGLGNVGTGVANAANGGLGVGGGYTAAGAGAGAAGAGAAVGGGGAAAAIPEVVVTAGGGGGGAAAAGGAAAGGGAAASQSKGFDWQKMLGNVGNQFSSAGNQQQQQEEAALDALARRGPPPNVGGSNVGPVPVDQYRDALAPGGIRGALS